MFSDIPTLDACFTMQTCLPVIDVLLANMHYGVPSFTQLDFQQICL